MGDDNWEPSSWYRNGYVPPRRRARRDVKKRVHEAPAPERSARLHDQHPGGLKRAIKEILLDSPDASIAEIIDRLNTDIRISPITVSAIKTEFRHSLRVIEAAGLMIERPTS